MKSFTIIAQRNAFAFPQNLVYGRNHDGDGKRVKSILSTNITSTTTYFVGAHYEIVETYTGTQVNKYYYAGSQRIAMRSNGTLFFMLTDHLGSTSLTTSATGMVISEMRYKAWGEVRYSSGTTPTQYQYTGQFSYETEFGLYFYNARWYDPSLSRFAQADSIVSPGVQGLDRYAYTLNNPLRYIDPSGYTSVCANPATADPECFAADPWQPTNANPFTPSQQDVDSAIATGYQASLERGMEFVNGLLRHQGWWSPYLTSGDFAVVWKFLLAFAYLWESYSYKSMSDWGDFKSLMTESIINKAGELYKNHGVAGLYVYLGGREALFKARGNMSDNDPRWQKGTGAYLNTWDLRYLGAENVWNEIYVKGGAEMNTAWPGVVNWKGTVGRGAWDYGVTPPMPVDESKVVWKGETINGTVNPWSGIVEPYYVFFIKK